MQTKTFLVFGTLCALLGAASAPALAQSKGSRRADPPSKTEQSRDEVRVKDQGRGSSQNNANKSGGRGDAAKSGRKTPR